MGNKVKNQRIFLVFNKEDSGYGTGQEPSGYVKIEVRDGSGKLTAAVQNLKEDRDDLKYKLYLIKCTESSVCPVCAGTLPVRKNKSELQWEFDPQDVARTGNTIEEFNIAAVVADAGNKHNVRVISPLAAYKNAKVHWKDKVKDYLYPAVPYTEKIEGLPKEVDFISKYENDLESKYVPGSTAPLLGGFGIPIAPEETYGVEGMNAEFAPEAEENPVLPFTSNNGLPPLANENELPPLTSDNEMMIYYEEGENENLSPEVEMNAPEMEMNIPQAEIKGPENSNAAQSEEPEAASNQAEPVYSGVDADLSNYAGMYDYNELFGTGAAEGENSEVQNMTNNCAYKSNFCDNKADNMDNNACANCQLNTRTGKNVEKPENKPPSKPANSIDNLISNLDRYFESCDPFKSRRRDYRWWKVNNPVYLNNIMYQCNIKTPLLFNPRVMMAHFKYKHLIVGIYSDRLRRREYIVCGIPGVHSIDEKPFGDLCRWVQIEGSRPRYGAFGYWLVYIDYKTGKFLNPG